MTKIVSILVGTKQRLPRIFILAQVRNLAYIYIRYMGANTKLILYKNFEKNNLRTHTLEGLLRIKGKKRKDQRV